MGSAVVRLRRALAFVVLALLGGIVAEAAPAAAPRGNANYVAVDSQGRPAVTLWMRTETRMMIFVCYRWGAVDHGDHYNNSNPIVVNRQGWFSYDGPGVNLHQKVVHLRLSGHFVSKDEAVGKITAPCETNHAFEARFAP